MTNSYGRLLGVTIGGADRTAEGGNVRAGAPAAATWDVPIAVPGASAVPAAALTAELPPMVSVTVPMESAGTGTLYVAITRPSGNKLVLPGEPVVPLNPPPLKAIVPSDEIDVKSSPSLSV